MAKTLLTLDCGCEVETPDYEGNTIVAVSEVAWHEGGRPGRYHKDNQNVCLMWAALVCKTHAQERGFTPCPKCFTREDT